MIATNVSHVRSAIAEAYPFEVSKLPLFGPDRERTGHYGLFRSDNAECVGNACKRGYEPHTLDDVQALAEAASVGFDSSRSIVSCTWNAGHTVVIGPTDEYRRAIFGSADNIFPRFILQAGYDGRAFTASLGLYRDACKNLMRIRSASHGHQVSLKHTSKLRTRMPRLIETFQTLAASWDTVTQTVHRMQETEVDFREFVATMYPLPDNATHRQVRAYERRAVVIVERLMNERYITGRTLGTSHRATAWEALNAIQGYVQHDKSRKGRPTLTTRAIMALSDSDVDRALALAIAV